MMAIFRKKVFFHVLPFLFTLIYIILSTYLLSYETRYSKIYHGEEPCQFNKEILIDIFIIKKLF